MRRSGSRRRAGPCRAPIAAPCASHPPESRPSASTRFQPCCRSLSKSGWWRRGARRGPMAGARRRAGRCDHGVLRGVMRSARRLGGPSAGAGLVARGEIVGDRRRHRRRAPADRGAPCRRRAGACRARRPRAISWVTMKMVMPVLAPEAQRAARACRRGCRDRARRTARRAAGPSGRRISAWAMASRCCMPPESARDRGPAHAPRPTASSIAVGLADRAAGARAPNRRPQQRLPRVRASRPRMTFSSTVRCGNTE